MNRPTWIWATVFVFLFLIIIVDTSNRIEQVASALSIYRDEPLQNSPLVVRIYYEHTRDLIKLADYDIWEFNNTKEKYVLASLNAEAFADLKKEGWRVTVDRARMAAMPFFWPCELTSWLESFVSI